MLDKILKVLINCVSHNICFATHIIDKRQEPSCSLSEMMAAFTGTPAFLAFRSELYRKFGRDVDCGSFESALQSAGALWRAYNDRFLEEHLLFLRSYIRSNDAVLLVLDTASRWTILRLTAIRCE